MGFGSELRQRIVESGKQQKELAFEFFEAIGEREPGFSLKQTTVESHLSRLVNEAEDGVRFFFNPESQLALLLDLLGVSDGERTRLVEQGRALLPTGAARAQLVIDATPWSAIGEDLAPLFDAIEKQVLLAGVSPMLLLVTEAQHRKVPLPFGSMKGLVVEPVASQEEGRARAREAAQETALVAPPYPATSYERWLALEFHGGKLVLEPADAISVFARKGALPSLPPVAHPIEGVEPAEDVEVDASPIALRQCMRALADEEEAETLGSPARRVALARRLGVKATSTPLERETAEVDRLTALASGPVVELAAASFEVELSRARRRPTSLIARVENRLHLVNPSPDTAEELLSSPLVATHRIEAPTPALLRLQQAVSDWTQDDLIDDPVFDALVDRLSGGADDRKLLQHAAATLLACDAVPASVESPPVSDWRPALSALVAADPPPVTFLFRSDEERFATPQMMSRPLPVRPSLAGARFRPDDKVGLVREKESDTMAVPSDAASLDVETWLTAVDSSAAIVGYRKEKVSRYGREEERRVPPVTQRGCRLLGYSVSSMVPFSDRVDFEAQMLVAAAILGLRVAADRDAIRMPDGRFLLPLGGRWSRSPACASVRPGAEVLGLLWW